MSGLTRTTRRLGTAACCGTPGVCSPLGLVLNMVNGDGFVAWVE